MAINPLSFNIFIHALQVLSSSGDFDCNRNVLSTVFLSSCKLVCLLKYKENKMFQLVKSVQRISQKYMLVSISKHQDIGTEQ
jgi:hypothetical protein